MTRQIGSWRAALGIGGVLAMACGSTTTSGALTKDPKPAPSAHALDAVDAGPSIASAAPIVPPPPPMVPELVAEPFAPAGSTPAAVFAIEGAVVVTDGKRIGRITGESVEWVGKIPKATPGFGENVIVSVHGRYPDRVDALYETSIGRAPAPTFFAVTGKGTQHTEAPGGGWGSIHLARVGDSTILAGASIADGHRLITVRGPKVARSFTTAKSLCKPGELLQTFTPPEAVPAIPPAAFESSTAGTLMSLGTLCEKRGPAAEVWDKTTGKSQIVDLGSWWKRLGSPRLLKASGDELWAFGDEFQSLLHYVDGSFAPVPELGVPIEDVFVSPTGQLHARTSSQRIYRLTDGKWSALARIADSVKPSELRGLVVDAEGAFWGWTYGSVLKLRESPRDRAPAEEACKSWFVYLYAASSSNDPKFTYPATRKALSTFPEVASLGLVEFGRYPRHVGVTVTSRSQGEAVIAHVKATMKDEVPKLFCYVPTTPRPIDMK